MTLPLATASTLYQSEVITKWGKYLVKTLINVRTRVIKFYGPSLFPNTLTVKMLKRARYRTRYTDMISLQRNCKQRALKHLPYIYGVMGFHSKTLNCITKQSHKSFKLILYDKSDKFTFYLSV